jgi:hypothetical protein
MIKLSNQFVKQTTNSLGLIIFLSFQPFVNLIIKSLRLVVELPFKLDTAFLYFFILIVFLNILFYSFGKKINFKNLLIIVFILLSFLYSFLNNLTSNYVIGEVFINFLLYSLPVFIIVIVQSNSATFFKYIFYSSIIIFLSILLEILFFNLIETISLQYYSQTFSYLALFPAIINLNIIFERKNFNFMSLVIGVLSVIMIYFFGARGPLLIVFIFIYFRITLKLFKYKKNLMLVVFFIVTFFMVTNVNQFLNSISEILIFFNFDSRLLDYIRNFQLFSFESREGLYTLAIQIIEKNLIFGIGLGADRIYILDLLNIYDLNSIMGLYSHNIFLEIMLSFGLIFGVLFILFFFIRLIYIFKNHYQNLNGEITLILLSLGFLPLLISGSFINSPLFFALIAFLLSPKNSDYHIT